MNSWPNKPPLLERVVFVSWQIPETGGCGTATEILAEAMTRRGVVVEYVSIIPGVRTSQVPTVTGFQLANVHDGPAFRQAKGFFGRVRGLGRLIHKRRDRAQGLKRIRRHLKNAGRETVLIFTNVGPKKLLDDAGYRLGSRDVVTIGQHHSSFAGAAATQQLSLIPKHFGDVDAFVTLTSADASEFAGILDVPCLGIPNIAREFSTKTRQPQRIAVALVRYSSEKRLDVMVRAFGQATAPSALRDWELRIYGSGSHEALASLVDDLGLGDRVRLHGRTDNIADVLSSAGVNLLTSEFEGFPMSVLEASSMGVPTVAFECSAGMRELVPESAGILVRQGDFAAYVSALRTMLNDENLRRSKGEAAAASVLRFSEETVVAHWFEAISQCYQRRELASTS